LTAWLRGIRRNPRRGVQLPSIDKAEGEAMFLTHSEYNMILEVVGERYKTFTNFLVMTGIRIGGPSAAASAGS
jgi:hypothetical protein